MKRRDFFKRLGTIGAVSVTTPMLLFESPEPVIEQVTGNEGIWHQLKRGKTISYNNPNGITREHIKQATEYVFRVNRIPVDRQVNIKYTLTPKGYYVMNGVTYTTLT